MNHFIIYITYVYYYLDYLYLIYSINHITLFNHSSECVNINRFKLSAYVMYIAVNSTNKITNTKAYSQPPVSATKATYMHK